MISTPKPENSAAHTKKPPPKQTTGRRLFQQVKPYWPWLLLGVFSNLGFASLDASFAYFLKPLLNKGFIERDLTFISWVPLILLAAFTLRGILSALGGFSMTWMARRIVTSFRQSIFKHSLHLPAKFYDKNTKGQLLSKLLYDAEQIAQVGTDAITTLLQASGLIIGLFVVMFVISWQLSLVYFTIIPIIAFIVRLSNRRTRRLSHGVQTAMGEVTHIAEETIEGYRDLRVYGAETYEWQKFKNATESTRQKETKVAATKAYNVMSVQIIASIGISFIIFLAMSPGGSSTLSPGGFVSMIAAMVALLKPLKNLTTVNNTIQRGLAGAHSIFQTLDEPLERDLGHRTFETSVKGEVTFSHVYFAYNGLNDAPQIKNIHFTIPPGQSVALVGPSGSGKSTIASLLAGFYEIQQGDILVDGISINELSLKTLRRQIGFVSQRVTLCNDTIANNIRYGMGGEKSLSDVIAASKAAHAWEFIKTLPKGLDTVIGDNGVLLSGGQRQRIALARAFLKDAPILILDEATSALDPVSERHIQAALASLMGNRTTLIIAHRLSTIEKANTILVMQSGEIIERGTHPSLLQQKGFYAELYKSHRGSPNDLAPLNASAIDAILS